MDKFKAKYLGKGEIFTYSELTQKQIDDNNFDRADVEDDRFVEMKSKEVFNIGSFMRCEHTGPFDGFASCTNASAYGIKISKDGQTARIWTVY